MPVLDRKTGEDTQCHPAMTVRFGARCGMMIAEGVRQKHRNVCRQPKLAEIVALCDLAPTVAEDGNGIGRLLQHLR